MSKKSKIGMAKARVQAPRLIDYDGDVSKRWYILFYVENSKGERIRKRYTRLNHIANAEGRRAEAAKMIAEIGNLLKNGYKAQAKEKPQAKTVTLLQAFEMVIAYKDGTLRPHSVKPYRTMYKYIQVYLQGRNPSILQFNKVECYQFMNQIRKTQQWNNKTYNNYCGTLYSAFEHMKSLGFIKENPCQGLPKLQITRGRHFPFTKDQLHDLKLAIESSGETQFFVFVQMLYYTCARPVELCRLRISDIRENTILFRSENSKNKKAQHVMIPPQLQVVIEQSGLRSFPPNYFVFSATGKPGAKQIGEKHFYKRQVALLKKLGYNDAPYTLYSYKHTAVCQMYMAGIDIKSIQAQCRHSDIKQTDTYLKDLGLIRNDEVMNQFPDF